MALHDTSEEDASRQVFSFSVIVNITTNNNNNTERKSSDTIFLFPTSSVV
jgi:hypothetical protein